MYLSISEEVLQLDEGNFRFQRYVAGFMNPEEAGDEFSGTSVSYTHLTLPTICSV